MAGNLAVIPVLRVLEQQDLSVPRGNLTERLPHQGLPLVRQEPAEGLQDALARVAVFVVPLLPIFVTFLQPPPPSAPPPVEQRLPHRQAREPGGHFRRIRQRSRL